MGESSIKLGASALASHGLRRTEGLFKKSIVYHNEIERIYVFENQFTEDARALPVIRSNASTV